jgi:hypothetical protein
MSEARTALIFWFFFIKEKEHPPATLRAVHPAPRKEHTPGLLRRYAPANDDYSSHFPFVYPKNIPPRKDGELAFSHTLFLFPKGSVLN